MEKKPPQKVGNEFSNAKYGVLDLRNVQPKPAKKPLQMPALMPPKEVIRRATAPPVKVSFHPMQVTKPEINQKLFIDAFAYDLLFIAVATLTSIASPFRDWLFLAYLLIALIFRVSSQRIFTSALFCLVLIPVLTVFKRTEPADMFAVFTFYFLCIGVVRAIIELRKDT